MKKATGVMFLLLSMIGFAGCESETCNGFVGEETCDAALVEFIGAAANIL